jgi:hypothetical protein
MGLVTDVVERSITVPPWGDGWRVAALVGDPVVAAAAARRLAAAAGWSVEGLEETPLRAATVDELVARVWPADPALLAIFGLAGADVRARDRLLVLTEQPPPSVRIVLCVDEVGDLPDTLLSRVEVFAAISTPDLVEELSAAGHDRLARLARIGAAPALLVACEQDAALARQVEGVLAPLSQGQRPTVELTKELDRTLLAAARAVLARRATDLLRSPTGTEAAAGTQLLDVALGATSLTQLVARLQP